GNPWCSPSHDPRAQPNKLLRHHRRNGRDYRNRHSASPSSETEDNSTSCCTGLPIARNRSFDPPSTAQPKRCVVSFYSEIPVSFLLLESRRGSVSSHGRHQPFVGLFKVSCH